MHIPSLDDELEQIIADTQNVKDWADHVSQQTKKVLHQGQKLRIAIEVLDLIAGTNGTECSYPRAEAAEALRKIRESEFDGLARPNRWTALLLLAEVTQQECSEGCGVSDAACAVCHNPLGERPDGGTWGRSRSPITATGHVAECPLDAALHAMGLDTREKRDAARKQGGGEP